MSRNGSGTYNLPAGNPVITGSTISSTWANNTLNDIATALTGSIAKDGQTTPTGNLPMGGYAHTNTGDATVRAMYATAGQVQDGAFTLLSSVSGTDTITATGAIGMASYVAGQRFNFVAANNNTGATTININAIGAKSITKGGTTALAADDIIAGAICQIVYDGTQFQLLNPSPGTSVTSFSAGTTGLTPSTGTTGAVTLAGTLGTANGGTGLTTVGTNGQVLQSNGTSLAWGSISGFANMQVFTSSGTFTVPSGVTKVKVTVVGGGGAGSAGTYNAGGNPTSVGTGGGGGGAAIKIISGLTPGGTVSVTVGAAAGTSSFGAYCSATGGANATGTTYIDSNSFSTGGVGSSGDLNIGGSAGTRYSEDAPQIGGVGGASIFGGGGCGAIRNSTGGTAGADGSAYGGGGGGGSAKTTSNNGAGGAGASGVVIVEY